MLPRSRILRSAQVADTMRRGSTRTEGPFIWKITKNTSGSDSQVAIVIAKKILKKAAARNSLKRKIFSIFTEIKKDIPRGYAIVILTQGGVDTLTRTQMREYFIKLLKSLH